MSRTRFYIIGTVAGPHPYPAMVRDFQCVIGEETSAQMLEAEGRLPNTLVACIGGGSNAMGLFHPFLDDRDVEIIGVEAGGHGVETGRHAASLTGGRPGVLHGNRTYLLQDDDGQIIDAHSISAGLDYPGIGPEHSWLHDIEARELCVGDRPRRRCEAFQILRQGSKASSRRSESAHALAHVKKMAPTLPKDHLLVINPSRPRRQGYLRRRREAGRQAMSTRIERRFAELKAAKRGGLVTFVTAGDPNYEVSREIVLGAAQCRRRCDRDRHAVHRPDGRRPGDPGLVPARPQERPGPARRR